MQYATVVLNLAFQTSIHIVGYFLLFSPLNLVTSHFRCLQPRVYVL